ncbi:hypothetical protein [Actinoplanes sp. NPDC049265]|uniref:hypothetical protein n=1 Tax=Actinoplanes sp. NPDC049265 TaxID=3363902 RepID=UPI003721FDBA
MPSAPSCCRWPDLAHRVAPSDPGRADRFGVLTLPDAREPTSLLPAIAHIFGLECYDPDEAARLARAAGHAWILINLVRSRHKIN